jgi:uncharacterized membrane protein
MTSFKSSALFAAAVATMALSGSFNVVSVAAAADTVHCAGINSCKGTSECKSFDHGCKGMNSCKGQGFLSVPKADCAKQGGKVIQ